jgi:lipoyl-dependent peroxiredoxin
VVATAPRDGGGFGIAVNLQIEERSIDPAELERFVREAHQKTCPYSHATRGNVPVILEVIGK